MESRTIQKSACTLLALTFLFFGSLPICTSTYLYSSIMPPKATIDLGCHEECYALSLEQEFNSKEESYGNNGTSGKNISLWSEENMDSVSKLWELSTKEICQLQDLYERLRDIDHWKNDPFEVVRFIRAYPNNVDRVEKSFRKMIQWRIDNSIDTSFRDWMPPQELMDFTPATILKGTDYDGDPIYVERTGALDATGILKKYGREIVVKHAIWLREQDEWFYEYEKESNRLFKTMTIVIDLKGLNLIQHCSPDILKAYNEIMDIDDNYYPHTEKRIIIIRAPGIFCFVWNIVKNFIGDSKKDKIVLTDKKNYLKSLSKYMDLNILPTEIYPESGNDSAAAKGMPQMFHGGKIYQ